MKMSKVDLSFQSCKSEYADADVVIFSVPMDATTSFRPGTRFAGNAIRVDSFGVEWYSPYRERDLNEFKTADIGDLDLPIGAVEDALDIVYDTTKKILEDQKVPMMVGGEHLVSYPVIKAVYESYPDLHIIHLDAHTDLREQFFGRELSHATFMRHVHKFVGDGKIFQFGIRSGEKPEFDWAKKENGHIHQRKFDFVGLVLDYDKETKMATIQQRNNFAVGQEVEFFGPDTKFSQNIQAITDEAGNELDAARHPLQIVKVKVDNPVNSYDMMRKEN